VAALTSERGALETATTDKEHIMNATHHRRTFVQAERGAVGAGAAAAATARRSQTILIVLALALGAILLALSAPAAHAGPGGGPSDTPSPPKPLQVHASQNPVIFESFQTTKTITLTWTPHPKAVWSVLSVSENGAQVYEAIVPAEWEPLRHVPVTYGKTYTAHVTAVFGPLDGETGPPLTITTKRAEIATPLPQPPHIDPTLIPSRPDLN
jgi:hypothetical protein